MNKNWMIPPACAWVLAGCTMGLRPEGVPPRPESVSGILMKISKDQLAANGTGVDAAELAKKIGANLEAWGFPTTGDPRQAHSHVMEPKVSGVENATTPTGFSFSAGNSDPRALQFQRADVVTVTCTIRGTERSHENAYLKESFMAESGFGKTSPFEAYTNRIGTACFNLLTELKIKRSKPDPQHTPGTTSSTWFPEVRIEVRDKPVGADSPVTPVAAPKAAEGVSASPAPTSKRGASKPQPPAASTTEPKPTVQTEIKDGETRKQMIIHNQGSPIILEFGYERK